MLIIGPYGFRTFLSDSRKNSENIGLLKIKPKMSEKLFLYLTFKDSVSNQYSTYTHFTRISLNKLNTIEKQEICRKF